MSLNNIAVAAIVGGTTLAAMLFATRRQVGTTGAMDHATSLELRAQKDHERALQAQAEAQKIAAEASAAIAASALLKENQAVIRSRVQDTLQLARDLEIAAKRKREEAAAIEQSVKVEAKNARDTEREVEHKLLEQERVMREAARLEERARFTLARAAAERAAAAEAKNAERMGIMAAAEAAARREVEKSERERAAAAEIQDALAMELRRARERSILAQSAEETINQTTQREAELARTLNGLHEELAVAQREKQAAEKQLRAVQEGGAVDAKIARLQKEIERHNQAAGEHQRNADLAIRNRDAALADQTINIGLWDRLRGWMQAEGTTVAAVSDSTASAAMVEDGTTGPRVDATGTANVTLYDTKGAKLPGGSTVSTSVRGPVGTSSSSVQMQTAAGRTLQ